MTFRNITAPKIHQTFIYVDNTMLHSPRVRNFNTTRRIFIEILRLFSSFFTKCRPLWLSVMLTHLKLLSTYCYTEKRCLSRGNTISGYQWHREEFRYECRNSQPTPKKHYRLFVLHIIISSKFYFAKANM